MNKERIKRGLTECAPFILLGGLQIPFMFDEGGFFNTGVLVGNALCSYMLYKKGVEKFDREQFVKSPLCQEYLGLYDDFVTDVAKLYEDLGIDSGVESAVAYMFCLENGIFSKDGTNQYTLFEDDSDKFIAFYGGRVTTGKHCCRHSASLFSDINCKMEGGLSPKISVCLGADYSRKFKIQPDHLVSGLVHKNKRLLFDSTSSFTKMFADGLSYFKDDKVMGRVVAENVTGIKSTLVGDVYDNKRLSSDLFDRFMKLESIKNSNEIFDDFMNALVTVTAHVRDFRDFHEEEKPKILQLSNLSTIVSPHGEAVLTKK